MEILKHLDGFPEEPLERIIAASTNVLALLRSSGVHAHLLEPGTYQTVLMHFAILSVVADEHAMFIDRLATKKPSIFEESTATTTALYNYATAANSIAKQIINERFFNESIDSAKALLSGSSYTFKPSDLSTIQNKVNSLRDMLSECKSINVEHRCRLLLKLEKLQAELHKSMPNLDRIGGFIIEAGIILGRFGKEVKPLVDRIKELSEAVWTAQCPTKSLPESNPDLMLPPNKS